MAVSLPTFSLSILSLLHVCTEDSYLENLGQLATAKLVTLDLIAKLMSAIWPAPTDIVALLFLVLTLQHALAIRDILLKEGTDNALSEIVIVMVTIIASVFASKDKGATASTVAVLNGTGGLPMMVMDAVWSVN